MSQRGSEHESEIEDSSDDSVNEEEIRQQIVLSPNQLREIGDDDTRFFEVVRDINDKAVSRIKETKSKAALVYLSQAQRILEYGACCGKVIDRNLIICVLQNEAAAYQRIWDLNKCSKYIEAVIYNIEESLKGEEEQYRAIQMSDISEKDYELLCSVMKRKIALVQYYLQFCAIMSQLKSHEVALSWSVKAVSLMKELLSNFHRYLKANINNENMATIGKKLKILKELSFYKENLELSDQQNLLARTRYVFKEWRNNRSMGQENEIQEWIRTYSIGNAMQMEPCNYHEFNNPADFKTELEMQSLIKKVLLFAISYFTVATEIRLIEVEKFTSEEEKRKSQQFQRSELYHLTAIKIFYTYVNYESMFIKHVLHSFRNHYRPELEVEQAPQVPDLQIVEKVDPPKLPPPVEQRELPMPVNIIRSEIRDQEEQQQVEIQVQTHPNRVTPPRSESHHDDVNMDNQNDNDDEMHIKPLNNLHLLQSPQQPKKKKKKAKQQNPSETLRPITGRSLSKQTKAIKGLGSPTARPQKKDGMSTSRNFTKTSTKLKEENHSLDTHGANKKIVQQVPHYNSTMKNSGPYESKPPKPKKKKTQNNAVVENTQPKKEKRQERIERGQILENKLLRAKSGNDRISVKKTKSPGVEDLRPKKPKSKGKPTKKV